MKPRVLAVDDEDLILNSFRMIFSGSQYELEVAKDATECLRLVRQHPLRYAVVFLDYNLSVESGRRDQRGDFVAKRLKEINSDIMVVMMSGDRSPEAFRHWIAAGVDQYLYKPVAAHQAMTITEYGCSRYEAELAIASGNIEGSTDAVAVEALRACNLVSHSPAVVRAAQLAVTFAQNKYNVLILGETGTGKEMFAKAIHGLSELKKKPYLPINCSSYANNENLLESELFGHEKGSFTGADKLKIGVFEAAMGGVVFLDEIHHLGPNAQKKLLRVIQERKVRRVGGNIEIPVRFRLVAAGKPELKEMSREGSFAGDLYYRIKELPIELPPLRERREDIRPLAMHFKSVFEHEMERSIEFMESTLEFLQVYDWPGNVREIENTIKELMVTVKGPAIKPEDLPIEIRNHKGLYKRQGKLISFNMLLAEQERQQIELIIMALKETAGNVSQAAALLEIARSTLRDLMKKFRIEEFSGDGLSKGNGSEISTRI